MSEKIDRVELEADYNKRGSNGNSDEYAYTVEARYNYHEPTLIGDQLFDMRWRRVTFKESVIGVPAAEPFRRLVHEHRMLGYSAAQALRWWMHATADAGMNGLCLETRLVRHKITQSFTIEAVDARDPVAYGR